MRWKFTRKARNRYVRIILSILVSSTTTTNEDIKVNLTTPTEYTIEYKKIDEGEWTRIYINELVQQIETVFVHIRLKDIDGREGSEKIIKQ